MVRTKLRVLYVPGLGDTNLGGQRLAVWIWHLWGVQAEIVPMHWESSESTDSKLTRLLERIDALAAQKMPVGLVGVSAGASMVITAYSLRKSQLAGCVLLAGKVNRAAAIGARYRAQNPALVDSVQACERALATLNASDRMHIQSRYGLIDPVVARADSSVPGAQNHRLWAIGHTGTIVVQLVFGAPLFLRFLKKAARRQNMK